MQAPPLPDVSGLRWEWLPVSALARPHPSAAPGLRRYGELKHLLETARRLSPAEAIWLAVLCPVIVTPRREELLVVAGFRTLAVCRAAAPGREMPVLVADTWTADALECLIWLALALPPLALSVGRSTATAAQLKSLMDTHLAGAEGSRLADVLAGLTLQGVRTRHGLAKTTRTRRDRLPPRPDPHG